MIATAKGGIPNVFVFVFSNVISVKEPHTNIFPTQAERAGKYVLHREKASGDVGTCTFFPGE